MLIDDIERRMRLDEMDRNIDISFKNMNADSGAALSHASEWYERMKQMVRDIRWLIAEVKKGNK